MASDTSDLTDQDYRDFLDALDDATFSVTDWEAKFIESTVAQKHFTPRQRESIDRMIEKYETRVNW